MGLQKRETGFRDTFLTVKRHAVGFALAVFLGSSVAVATNLSFQYRNASCSQVGGRRVCEYRNVAPGIKARVAHVGEFNAELGTFDDESLGVKDAFQPRVRKVNGTGWGYVEFEIAFFDQNTGAPVAVDFPLTAVDVDGDNSKEKEGVGFLSITNYTLERNTSLLHETQPGSDDYEEWHIFKAKTYFNRPGIDYTSSQAPKHMVHIKYQKRHVLRYRAFVYLNTGTNSSYRMFSLYFKDKYQSIDPFPKWNSAATSTVGIALSGRVFEDVAGDGSVADDPGTDGAAIKLIDENGNLVRETRTVSYTSSAGVERGWYRFVFPKFDPAKRLYVVVDSKTIEPSQGLNQNYTSSFVWAEQTYGPKGGYCANPLGLLDGNPQNPENPYRRETSGPCFGGKTGDRSDDASTLSGAEHLAEVELGEEDVSNVDFGFSFNVVTNTNDKDDDDLAERYCQGCFRQFVQNANAIYGKNRMRFVPVVAKNAPSQEPRWWSTEIRNLDSNVEDEIVVKDDLTYLDGTAFDYSNGSSILNTNPTSLNVPVDGVGVSNTPLAPFEGPEFELSNANPSSNGIRVAASQVSIEHMAIYRMRTRAAVYVDSGVSEVEIKNNFLGARADGSDPGSFNSARYGVNTSSLGNTNLKILHNFIAYTGNSGVNTYASGEIAQNWFSSIGKKEGCSDGVTIHAGADPVISNNYFERIAAYGIDAVDAEGGFSIVENTITGTGIGDESGNTCARAGAPSEDELGGIRVGNRVDGALIQKNVIYKTPGHGIVVSGQKVKITQNSIFDNAGISIDLFKQQVGTYYGDGVTPNNEQEDSSWGNRQIDYPVITEAVLAEEGVLAVQGFVGVEDPDVDLYQGKDVTLEFFKADADTDDDGEDETDNNGEVIQGDGLSVPHGEGRWFLGSCTLSLGEGGRFSCALRDLPEGVTLEAGDSVTAVVIDGDGNTSEFGANAPVKGLEAFDCASAFYQVVDRELRRLNPTARSYELVGRSMDRYDAMGWHPSRNVIYALGAQDSELWKGHLLVVDRRGVAHDLGKPLSASGDELPTGLVAADMDDQGYLYAVDGLDLIRIDVDRLTYERLNFRANFSAPEVKDVAYVPATRSLWGAQDGTLYRWKLDEGTVEKVDVAGLPDGVYSAVYTASDGKLYFIDRDQGKIYKVQNYTEDQPEAVFLIQAEALAINDGASCPSADPPAFGIPVSGRLYHDLAPNGVRDDGDLDLPPRAFDEDRPPTLYVKLFKDSDANCGNGYETPASQVVEVGADGHYRFDAVPAGQYCLVLSTDDQADQANVFNPSPYHWLAIRPEDRIRPLTITPEQVAGWEASRGHDFGFFHGAKVSGTVFDDTGHGQDPNGREIFANDAVQDGEEPGLSGVVVTAQAGDRTRSVKTDSQGRYTLYVPHAWGNEPVYLYHNARPASGYNRPRPSNPSQREVYRVASFEDAMAADAPGARIRLGKETDTAATLAGSTLEEHNFGVVRQSRFRPDRSGFATTPGTVTYTHTYKPGTLGTAHFRRRSGEYTYRIRFDRNCDGDFLDQDEGWQTLSERDDLELLVGPDWPRDPDGSLRSCAVDVRVLTPDGEPEGMVDLAEISASLVWQTDDAQRQITDVTRVVDTTTIRLLGTVRLEKLGCNVSRSTCDPDRYPKDYSQRVLAAPGEVLEYCIRYQNIGSGPVERVEISDPVPFFAEAVDDPDPYTCSDQQQGDIYWKDASGDVHCLRFSAGDGDAGELRGEPAVLVVRAEASLAPGQAGLVCYRVRVQ